MSAQSLLKWREAQAARSSFSCVPIALDACENWSLDKGVLRHRTGGFFSIPGLKCEGLPGREGPVYQPIIDQPEIGILGFALCERDGVPGIVVQAKTEPGNVGISQLAPTFQCTESNYKALHGGTPAPFLDWFSGVDARQVVSNGLQSEQATRFLGKRNRNLVVEVDEARTHDLPEAWRWIAMDDICDAILTDDLFNTDARSVLVSSAWNRLVRGRAPFTRRNDDLSAALALSFEQSGR